ncbi:MAG: DUF2167 domain-containing protein, partial [Myxococcota bacterium]
MIHALAGLLATSPALAVPEVAPAAEPEVAAIEIDEAYVAELTAWLQEDAPDVTPEDALEQARSMAAFEAMLPWETTSPVAVDEVASLSLSQGDRFLGPDGAAEVLAAWGNPPGQVHAGMLFPQGARVFGPDSWGVVIDYEAMGWVDDEDAATIDYDDLLAEMQANTREASEARREMGIDGIELVAWAEPPHYDAAKNVLYWARNLRSDDGYESLNYEVRVLGRGGVLSLNAVAGMDMLESTKTAMEPVRVAATFVPGQTYADYEPGVDPTAGIGIAALVAGGALAASKGGLLKGLLALLVAGKKFVVIAVVAVGAFFVRIAGGLFGR